MVVGREQESRLPAAVLYSWGNEVDNLKIYYFCLLVCPLIPNKRSLKEKEKRLERIKKVQKCNTSFNEV